MKYFYYYLIAINLIAFMVMSYDKHRAEEHKWRVSEARLFLLAFAFGSIGIWCGMYFFRHKTKHYKFVIGVPFILIAQVLIFYFLSR